MSSDAKDERIRALEDEVRKEIAGLRRIGRTICEFSRLAVDPDYSSRQLLTLLFSSAHQYALTWFGATDAVIEVNPRHARFYEREFGFVQIGDLRGP